MDHQEVLMKMFDLVWENAGKQEKIKKELSPDQIIRAAHKIR